MSPSNQGGRMAMPTEGSGGPAAPAATRYQESRQHAGDSARPGNPVGGVRYRDLHGAMRPMTGLDEVERPASRSPAGLLTRPLRPYAEIFTIPGAWRFSV